MLGVHINPLRDFSDHLKNLRKKAHTYASRLTSPHLMAAQIRIFHRAIYIPSMRYSLPVLAVDEEELETVQPRVVQVMLQRMHVSSTIPTSIRHGPLELGGLGIYDLRTEAGLEALKFFRNAIYADSEVRNLLRINLQYSQLESGIGGEPLLTHPNICLPYLTPSWILSLRQYLSCHDMTVTITDPYTVPLQIGLDQYIMQREYLQRYTPSQQRDLNLVRMYLQVTTLSEMSDPERQQAIHLDYLDAKRPVNWISDPRWPRQQNVSTSQCRLWKRYITSVFLRYIPYWKVPPTNHHDKSIGPSATQASIPTSFASLQEYLRTLPRTQRRLVSDWTQHATDLQVWRAMRSREKLHLATDGGLLGTTSTHGWVLATSKLILVFTGAGPVDGPFDLASSTRSELGGLAASLVFIVAISRHWGLRHNASFKWYADSKAAISRVNKFARSQKHATRMPHDTDLLSLIRSLLKELRRPFKPLWVKGHQDKTRSYDTLPRSVRMNIEADVLATKSCTQLPFQSSQSVDHQQSQQVSVTINSRRINSQFDESIRYHINGYHLRRYLQEKNSWSDETWNEIDFATFGKSFCRLSPATQVRQTKFVHGHLPIGTRRYKQARIKDEKLKVCPC